LGNGGGGNARAAIEGRNICGFDYLDCVGLGVEGSFAIGGLDFDVVAANLIKVGCPANFADAIYDHAIWVAI
jgi:hypothetical protein